MTGMFVGIHALLAERTQIPELAMSEDEGKDFMSRVQNVMRHYSIETTQKSIDFAALIGCASAIYGSRFMAYSFRVRMEKETKNERPENVVHFPQGVSGGIGPSPSDDWAG